MTAQEWAEQYRFRKRCEKCPLHPCKREKCNDMIVMHSGKWVLVSQRGYNQLVKNESRRRFKEARESFVNNDTFMRNKKKLGY